MQFTVFSKKKEHIFYLYKDTKPCPQELWLPPKSWLFLIQMKLTAAQPLLFPLKRIRTSSSLLFAFAQERCHYHKHQGGRVAGMTGYPTPLSNYNILINPLTMPEQKVMKNHHKCDRAVKSTQKLAVQIVNARWVLCFLKLADFSSIQKMEVRKLTMRIILWRYQLLSHPSNPCSHLITQLDWDAFHMYQRQFFQCYMKP